MTWGVIVLISITPLILKTMENNIITIILAILTILGNCGWLVSRAKYRQEVRRIKANAEREELDLSTEFVKEFRAQIYNPLADELNMLRAAIATIKDCPRYPNCPVSKTMQRQPDSKGPNSGTTCKQNCPTLNS